MYTAQNTDTEVYQIRLAEKKDIKGLIELWANYACLRQIHDSKRWNWHQNPSQIWAEHAEHIINSPEHFLTLCDFQDNGMTGFLLAETKKLPPYYKAAYQVNINEFYLRPKERSKELMKETIEHTLSSIRNQYNLTSEDSLILTIDILPTDQSLFEEVIRDNVHQSSFKYTFDA